MYRYERLLVPVGFEAPDPFVIRYAGLVSRMACSKEVVFVHVSQDHDVPGWMRGRFPELARTRKDSQAELEALVDREFQGGPTPQVRYAVLDGVPLMEILRQVREQNSDLVLVGRKRDRQEAGNMAERLARKAPCSVLVVPEGTQSKITSIVVGVDFSENARDALDAVVAFASAAETGTPRVYGLHIYSVPIGFYKTGKTYEEFAQIMKEHHRTQYDDFVADVDLRGINLEPTFLLDNKPTNGIQRAAEVLGVDLVVTGARGRGAGAAVLLGSVAERLIATTSTPLLAVKKKGQGMSFLEALLKI